MLRTTTLFIGLLGTFTASANVAQQKLKDTTIRIDGRSGGRIFEGIGAVSAGASSRLLIDYPEPYRSHILDYLFKPAFGAGFVYLKTEIGGDGNTTCGSEPSFARTKEEMKNPNFNRGYEYWLMRMAADRNPNIELDALEWSMPGWFKQIWGQDNADYISTFIDGAKHWGLNMKYIGGCWNERTYDRNWIVDTLRPTLNKRGYGHIRIGAPEGAGRAWAICDELIKDSVFRNTITSVSYHYPDSYMWRPGTDLAGKTAFETELPLWSGEDFSLPGAPWKNTTYLAKNILRCYIRQQITKVNLWCPIASMPDNSCFSNVGIMKGVSPWSGYYEVWPTIWAVAHFNQFAKPGWQYLNSGCGLLANDGAFCTYKSDDGNKDYSIVIVTGSEAQQLNFDVTNLSSKQLQVWKSNSKAQFIQQAALEPVNGKFSLALEANAIYTITTTKGQLKGSHKIPAQTVFPTSHTDDFNSYAMDRAPLSPKYFYDNSGAFELVQDASGNKYVQQSLINDITHWIPDSCAFTYVSQGTDWEDGSISSDVLVNDDAFNGPGYAGLIMRAAYDKGGQSLIPFGYRFMIFKDGTWQLKNKTQVLASGKTTAGVWHNLKLSCNKDLIEAFIDQQRVVSIRDNSCLLGASGYVSGFNIAKFDNLKLHYTPNEGKIVSDWAATTASSDRQAQEAWFATDINSLSKWHAAKHDVAQWLKIDLGSVKNITRIESWMEYFSKPTQYLIEYSTDNRNWKTFADKQKNNIAHNPCYVDKGKAKARWVRITVLPHAERNYIAIHEFKVYSN